MKHRKELLIFLFFTLLAVGFTYPLVFRMNTSVYGYPGDNFSTIWHRWWVPYANNHGLNPRYTPFLNAPFGRDLGVVLDTTVLYVAPFAFLTSIFNEVFAYNLIIFASFPLAAFTMYLLVKHLTKNRWAAILSGLIFSFSPYHFWKAYNHADLASIQWLPLYVLSLIKLFEERNYRWAFLTAVSFALVALTSFYYGYFMILFTIGFMVFYFIHGRGKNRTICLNFKMLKVLGLTGVLAAVFILPFTYKIFSVSLSSSGEALAEKEVQRFETTTDELLALSSRPWDFVIPSEHHPIFGKYASAFCGWLAERSGGFESQCTHYSWERNIYLGFVGILLSLFALKNFRKNKKWILIFAALAVLMVWASFPAFMNIKGHRFYFPSYFLHKFTPMFRTYVRLGVVVLLCVAVLAGFGFKFLLEKIKNKKVSVFCFLFSVFLILLDFTNIPPFRYTDLSETPPVYQWLKEQPEDFIIAEYPKAYSEAEAMFFQIIHQKRMATVTEELSDIYQAETVEKLRALGVKYVVVHTDNIFPGDPYNGDRRFQLMSPPGAVVGLKSVMPLPKAIVYEVL